MVGRSFAALIVLSSGVLACNQAFDLRPTHAVDADLCPGDRDCDGVVDTLDKCPDVVDANLDDTDEDGLGDACDPCSWSSSPDQDDDLDTLANAVDLCPGTADPGQEDGDGDHVGDACDFGPGRADALRCFADFAVADEWGVTGDWSVQASRLVHFPETGLPAYLWSPKSALFPGVTAFAIDVPTSANTGVPSYEIGVGVGATAQSRGVRCVARATIAGGTTVAILDALGNVLSEVAAAPLSPVSIRFAVRRSASASELACTVRRVSGADVTVTATGGALDDTRPLGVALIADGAHTVFLALSVYSFDP